MSPHPYSGTHNRERAAAIAVMVPGTPCPHCSLPMYPPPLMELDYDHVTPLALGGAADGPRRLSHASCNRREGQKISAARARGRGGRGGVLPPMSEARRKILEKWHGHQHPGGVCPDYADDEEW